MHRKWFIKRVLIFMLVVIIGSMNLSITSLGAASTDAVVIENPLLTVHYPVGGKTVKLKPGMSKKEVDELIGTPKMFRLPSQDYYKYNELIIAYDNERVAMIILDEKASLNGSIKNGIAWKEAAKQMGSAAANGYGGFIFKVENGKAELLTDPVAIIAAMKEPSAYLLDIGVNYFGDVSSIIIHNIGYKNKLDNIIAELNNLASLPLFPPPRTMTDISLATEDKRRKVSLKMNKKEVDKMLGKSKPFKHASGSLMYQYDGIVIYYRDGVVAGIQVDLDMESTVVYSTPRGLSLLSSAAKMERLYGKPTYTSGNIIDYKFYKDGNRLVKMTGNEPPKDSATKEIFYLSTIVTEDQNRLVTYMFIADRKFALSSK